MFPLMSKIGLIAVFMLCSNAVLGMYCSPKSIVLARKQQCNIHKNEQSIIPMELIVATAAYSSDETKEAFKKSCKDLNKIVSPYNPHFLVHPLFTASSKVMNKITLRYSWYNNEDVVESLKKHLGSSIVIPHYRKCDAYGTFIRGFAKTIAIELPGHCNIKYNIVHNSPYVIQSNVIVQGDDGDQYDSNIVKTVTDLQGDVHVMNKSELDLAMYCAIVCDDNNAIKALAPKIEMLYTDVNISGKIYVYSDLMIKLIKRKNKEAFEYMLKNDPYEIRKDNKLSNVVQLGTECTLLDYINFQKEISSEEKQEYSALCRQYGEKTSDEIMSKSNNCTIS